MRLLSALDCECRVCVHSQPTFEQRVTMMLKLQSRKAWANVVDVGTPDNTLLVPMAPPDFVRLLDEVKFTNGADQEVVAELYEKTVTEALSATTELRFVKQRWIDKDVKQLVKVLPFCKELRRLALDDNEELTEAGAETLAEELEKRSEDGKWVAAPNLTHIGHMAGRDFASSARLKEACTKRGIVLKSFAGLTGFSRGGAFAPPPPAGRRRWRLFRNVARIAAAPSVERLERPAEAQATHVEVLSTGTARAAEESKGKMELTEVTPMSEPPATAGAYPD